MPKYHYKQYLNRAFWNSLLAVLSAFVVVLIIVFGWQEIRSVMNRIIEGATGEPQAEEMDRLQLLESLKGDDNTSEEEKARLLEELRSEENNVSDEEKLRLLESLRSS